MFYEDRLFLLIPVLLSSFKQVDVTEIIDGHSSYLWSTQQILQELDLDTYYPVFNRSDAVTP